MLYTEYMKTLGVCPFCRTDDRLIKDNEYAFLTYSLAPYSEHHLLVSPKRHVESFLDLTEGEFRDIEELLRNGAKLLQLLGHTDYSILVRNGDDSGKSVRHLHYHIVPHVHIGDLDHNGEERRILTEREIDALMDECARYQSDL
jgi:diadenosine tetraphosphate (Ap4A) HIT family hydrolase